MRVWSEDIKREVKGLRKKGYSYRQLIDMFDVPKSTLHWWLRDISRPDKLIFENRKRWLEKIQPLGALANKIKREKRLEKLARDVKLEVDELVINKDAAKLILSMLYWAEGSKGRDILGIANTDPRLLLLFITLLRRCYSLDESKFRLRLYIHHYHDEETLKNYWSKLLGVDRQLFHKTHRKLRNTNKRVRRNFGGICTIRYNSVHLKDELLEYAWSVSGKIVGRFKVPVV